MSKKHRRNDTREIYGLVFTPEEISARFQDHLPTVQAVRMFFDTFSPRVAQRMSDAACETIEECLDEVQAAHTRSASCRR